MPLCPSPILLAVHGLLEPALRLSAARAFLRPRKLLAFRSSPLTACSFLPTRLGWTSCPHSSQPCLPSPFFHWMKPLPLFPFSSTLLVGGNGWLAHLHPPLSPFLASGRLTRTPPPPFAQLLSRHPLSHLVFLQRSLTPRSLSHPLVSSLFSPSCALPGHDLSLRCFRLPLIADLRY